MFENVDGRTDDGRRSHWYTNSSPRSLRLRCAKNFTDRRRTVGRMTDDRQRLITIPHLKPLAQVS